MTLAEAQVIAERHGCTFQPSKQYPKLYQITRKDDPTNFGFMDKANLPYMTEPEIVEFYIPQAPQP